VPGLAVTRQAPGAGDAPALSQPGPLATCTMIPSTSGCPGWHAGGLEEGSVAVTVDLGVSTVPSRQGGSSRCFKDSRSMLTAFRVSRVLAALTNVSTAVLKQYT
jgi:hypothetical protein